MLLLLPIPVSLSFTLVFSCLAFCIISFKEGDGRSLAKKGLFLLVDAAVAPVPIKNGFVAAGIESADSIM
jgi:hypothetical protein